MPAKTRNSQPSLEAQLHEITREFVAKIVSTIRNASFAEVAGYAPPEDPAGPIAVGKKLGRKPRQTSEKKAELLTRIVSILEAANAPLAVRIIAREAAIPPDRLAAPLLELRDQGKVRKHGDKRNTTYSLA